MGRLFLIIQDVIPVLTSARTGSGGDLLAVKRVGVSANVDKMLVSWPKHVVLPFFD